jgi:hypothetical protein
MAMWDLFSKRKKAREKAGQEDVFQYDDLPEAFRVQVIHIWLAAIGPWHQLRMYQSAQDFLSNRTWIEVFKVFAEEKGVFQLAESHFTDPFEQCQQYLLRAQPDDALDLIELTFRFISLRLRHLDDYQRRVGGIIDPDEAIATLNRRFREHGIGYEFAGDEIIRVDSKYIHAAAVRPALQLLHDAGRAFAGAMKEFLGAHERHRKGEQQDAIVWACKAFESTMKAICAVRGWPFDPHKDTASKLIDIVFAHGLVPAYLQSHVGALRTVLEAGVPTVRNKTSGHGQGATPVGVPDHYTAYVLHLTASNIVFLIECHNALT